MDKEAKAVTANEFFLEKEKQASTGETIVKVIVIISYVCMFANFIPSIIMRTFSVWDYIISILWSVCNFGLYLGRVWAKWVYIISNAIVILVFVIMLFHLAGIGQLEFVFRYPPTLISLATYTVQIASCVLLIRSKSVHEFL